MNAAEVRWTLREETSTKKVWNGPCSLPDRPLRNFPHGYSPTSITPGSNWSSTDLALELLWHEFRQQHPDSYSYSRFCKLHRHWKKRKDVIIRQDHRPGEKLFLYWAGATIAIDQPDGTTRTLVRLPPRASSYTYAEAGSVDGWELAQSADPRPLEFYGGYPQLLIPITLKPE